MIELHEVDFFVTNRKLLTDVSFTINLGDKMGIVGRNGCGKSTLLKIMAGNLEHHGGNISSPKGKHILMVNQDTPNDETTPLEYLRDSDHTLKQLYERIDHAKNTELAPIYEQISEREEYYERHAPRMLVGLGLDTDSQETELCNLSAGIRMRIALASALLQNPDVLLLDEPTNHLDLESTLWLEEYLKQYTGTFVIVSHDTNLLDAVTNSTCHIHSGNVKIYKCGYTQFKELYTLQYEKDKQKNAQIDKDLNRLDAFVRRNKAISTRTGQCTTREKLMDKMSKEKAVLVPEKPVIPLDFPEVYVPEGILVNMTELRAGYEDHTVFSNVGIGIPNDARIALLGKNGQGKSTLAKILSRKLEPLSGSVDFNPRLCVGYVSQDITDQLNTSLTVYQQLAISLQISNDDYIRSHLSHYGFDNDQLSTQVCNLSGGEKTRLTFAIISGLKPNMLVLDEPTNHLDIESRDSLIQAVQKFPGAVIIISHDWDFIRKTSHQFLIVNDGSVKQHFKGLDSYRHSLLEYLSKNAGIKAPKMPQNQAQALAKNTSISSSSKTKTNPDISNNNNNNNSTKSGLK